jgi:hypothetical protein
MGVLAPLTHPKLFTAWLRPLFRKHWIVFREVVLLLRLKGCKLILLVVPCSIQADLRLKLVQREGADSRDASSPVAARPYCWSASGACRLELLATPQRAPTKHSGQ